MNKENVLLVLLALLLLAGMLYTLFAEGNRSRHGYGLQAKERIHTVGIYGKPVKTGNPCLFQA